MPFCQHAMNCFDNSQIIFSAIDHQDRVEKVELTGAHYVVYYWLVVIRGNSVMIFIVDISTHQLISFDWQFSSQAYT